MLMQPWNPWGDQAPEFLTWVMSAILASANKTAMADGSAPPDPPQVHRDIQAAAYAALA